MALRRRQPPGPRLCDCAGRLAELEALTGALAQATVKMARLAKGDSVEVGLARFGVPPEDARWISRAFWARHT